MARFDLKDKVAIITGSGRGIGRALAMGLAEAGARIVVTARTQADIEAVASAITAAGGRALAVPADVTDERHVERLVRDTVREYGAIDVLVNNAGGTAHAPLLEMKPEEWDQVFSLNLRSVYLCTKAVGKVMVSQKRGSVINISARGAYWTSPGLAHYNAAKGALSAFTSTVAKEWGPHGVRVNIIVPGLIETELTMDYFRDRPERLQAFLARTPLGRIGKPEDIVGAAIFLSSDAASYITGATLLITGGVEGA